MHLQENTLFNLDPTVKEVKVTQNVAQYPLYHVTYSATKFEVATSYGVGGDTSTRQVAQWATIAHLGASIMFGNTIIDDAQRQVTLNLKQ